MLAYRTEITLSSVIRQSQLTVHSCYDIIINLIELMAELHKQQQYVYNFHPNNIKIMNNRSYLQSADLSDEQLALYRAPETFHRLKNIVNVQTELYSLGILMYYMYSGEHPIHASEGQSWAEAHLKNEVKMINQIDNNINSIILKLLNKNPNERYQTVLGLLADFKRVNLYSEQEPFIPGQIDKKVLYIDKFNLPLQPHIDLKLNEILNSHSREKVKVVYITGNVKCGKTRTLELIAEKARKSNYFSYFIEKRTDSPLNFKIAKQMIEQLFKTYASQPQDNLRTLISQLQQCKALDLAYVYQTFRTFKQYVKTVESTMVESLSNNDTVDIGIELQQLVLLLNLLNNNIRRPITVLLDDIDDYTSNEINQFFTIIEKTKKQIIVVLSYTQNQYINNGFGFEEYTLKVNPLNFDDTRKIISSIINDDSEQIRLLSQAALYRSQGNIYQLKQLIKQWIKEQQLYFNEEIFCWEWKDELIRNHNYSDEILQFMKQKIDELPLHIQRIIAVASLIGERINPVLIADVYEESNVVIHEAMRLGEEIGIVFYDQREKKEADSTYEYVFLHDDLKSYLQKCIEKEVLQWHYKIGLAIYDKHKNKKDSLKLSMYHFNLSHSLLSNDGLKSLVSKNFEMGLYHFGEQTFTDALYYFETGFQLCLHYPNTFEDYVYKYKLYLAATQYVYGEDNIAKQLFAELHENIDKLDLNELRKYYMWLMEIYALEEHQLSLNYGIEALKLFGWEINYNVGNIKLLKEIIETQKTLKKLKLGKIQTTSNTNEDFRTISRLAYGIFSALGTLHPKGLIHFYTRFLKSYLPEGMNGELAVTVSLYEFLIQRGAPELFKLFPTETFSYILEKEQYTSYHFYTLHALHSQINAPENVYTYLYLALNKAVEVNDYRNVNFIIIIMVLTFNEDIYKLEQLLEMIESDINTRIDIKLRALLDEIISYHRANKSETSLVEYIYTNYEVTQNHINFISMNRAEMSLIAGDYKRVLYWESLAKQTMIDLNWLQNRKIMLYSNLAKCALYHQISDDQQMRVYRKEVKLFIKKMKKWEGFYGFETSVYYLVMAEYEVILGRNIEAQSYFEMSIKLARDEKNRKIEAYALERLSWLFDILGSETGKIIALMDAISAYSSWGIQSKVNELNANMKQSNMPSKTESNELNRELVHHRTSIQSKYIMPNNEYHLEQLYELRGHWENHEFLHSFLQLACKQVTAEFGALIKFDDCRFTFLAHYGMDKNEHILFEQDLESLLHYSVNTLETYMYSHKDGYESTNHDLIKGFKSIIAIPVHIHHRNETIILCLTSSLFDNIFSSQEKLILELLLSRFIYLAEQEQVSGKQVTSYLQTSVQTEVFTTLIEPLTERENDVLREIVNGLSNDEICQSLNIKLATVKTHINNIYSKLGVKRRAQAIKKAKEMNLV